jgi:predicted dehydrogenase
MIESNSVITQDISRRKFLGKSATGAAALMSATFVSSKVFAQNGQVTPNDRINLGVIGIGPRCKYDLQSILKFQDVQCVAIADVQASRRDDGKKFLAEQAGPSDCKFYSDFREVLDRKDIDAVLIATGDRWHTEASVLAAEAGKDVYSEKPCGITIADCQRLSQTIVKTGRVFQAGTQRRSVLNFQKAVEIAQSGKLGKLQRLHASVYIPTLDNAWLPSQVTPNKEQCDWNMWLGPAAWRPFNQKYVDGMWRGLWDFDSGARLLDWGAHTVDLCQWANRSDDTLPIEYQPNDNNIVCKYANGVELIIDFLPEPFGNRDPHYITRLGTCPVRFVGEEGSIETGDEGELVASSESLAKELEKTPRVRGLDVETHARNFFDCIRTRKMPNANQEVMRRSHIACHTAAIAWILQRPLRIDPTTETFINDDEANLLRTRPQRKWS